MRKGAVMLVAVAMGSHGCGEGPETVRDSYRMERSQPARDFSTYSPIVARDQIFQLGRHGEDPEGVVVIRSTSAVPCLEPEFRPPPEVGDGAGPCPVRRIYVRGPSREPSDERVP